MGKTSFTELRDLLIQETILFRTIATTELEKRRHIATADGRRLQELTRKTEILLAEAELLSGRRSAIGSELLGASDPEEVTLRSLVDAALEMGDSQAEEFALAAAAYRQQIDALRANAAENERLLHLAGQALQRLQSGLQSAARETETYRPHGNDAKRKTSAVILNANA